MKKLTKKQLAQKDFDSSERRIPAFSTSTNKTIKDLKKVPKLKDLELREEIALIETGNKNFYSNWEVRPAGEHNKIYPPNGYSKQVERLKDFHDGKLKFPDQIFGLPQALDYIDELRRSKTDGKYPLARAKFEIVEVTIIKTVYKTTKI